MPHNKKTKIVATLGPATNTKEILAEMAATGVNVFRVNFSHADYDDVKERIRQIREINEERGYNVAILADLQGPKLRVGVMAGEVVVAPGDEITFVTGEPFEGTAKKVYMNYKNFPQDVKTGERILLDDGKLKLEIKNTNKKDEVIAIVRHGGILSSNKGVNLPNTKVSLPCLTEKDLIDLCAEQILDGEKEAQDGYVAPGGTEANIQAIWIYRNYYIKELNAKTEEIAVVYSKDSHYSMPKAANILNIKSIVLDVDDATRMIVQDDLEQKIEQAQKNGVKYFILVMNMSTTMFGSVDDLDAILPIIKESDMPYKVHADGAFGGFIYPFTNPANPLDFRNPEITSITLDAHKMLMAPYGTGMFLIRKGWMHYAATEEAQYVQGLDYTICGSRNGAQAVSIWMILSKYGPNGWMEKIFILQKRTDWLCAQLDKHGVDYYRNQNSNIVTMRTGKINAELAERFGLVPDKHHGPSWYKIFVMDHVSIEKLEPFVNALG